MTKLQAIRWFGSFACGERIVLTRDKFSGTNWGMSISDKNPRLKLPKDLNLPCDDYDKQFRANFINRCPMAKGFSTVTLTLLHECGHWATRLVVDALEYEKMTNQAYTQEMYMNIPWELIATDWAICWLHSPINRKIAKRFEKDYFGY